MGFLFKNNETKKIDRYFVYIQNFVTLHITIVKKSKFFFSGFSEIFVKIQGFFSKIPKLQVLFFA